MSLLDKFKGNFVDNDDDEELDEDCLLYTSAIVLSVGV